MKRNLDRRRWRCGALFAFLLAGLIGAGPAWAGPLAAAGERVITVTGVGSTTMKPNVLVMLPTVQGEAELAEDAWVKFRQNRRRAIESLEKLEIANIEIDGAGASIANAVDASQQQMVILNGQQPDLNPKVRVSEQLRIRVTKIDLVETEKLWESLVTIVDTVKDLGLQLGPVVANNFYAIQMQQGKPQTLVHFEVGDRIAAEDAAYADAFRAAKSRAAKLAELAEVRMGTVTGIEEVGRNAGPAGTPTVFGVLPKEDELKALEHHALGPVEVQVRIRVSFEIIGP